MWRPLWKQKLTPACQWIQVSETKVDVVSWLTAGLAPALRRRADSRPSRGTRCHYWKINLREGSQKRLRLVSEADPPNLTILALRPETFVTSMSGKNCNTSAGTVDEAGVKLRRGVNPVSCPSAVPADGEIPGFGRPFDKAAHVTGRPVWPT